jgi:transposase
MLSSNFSYGGHTMPAHRISMHEITELLRLNAAGLSQRQIAQSLGLSVGVINKYLQLAQQRGLSWPLPESLTETALARLLNAEATAPAPILQAPLDFGLIHRELQRKGVTRLLLWEEYIAVHPDHHYSYSQFCRLYREWLAGLKATMRQTHRAGEKMFVDYAGPTVSIIDASTGEILKAQVFVAVLGASNYTYAEATFTQQLPDWISSHVRAFEFFGGVPQLVIPDNLKSGVTKACRYEPLINRTYQEMLAHYGTAALPARPYKPRDKAKAEVAVQIVERWLLARLRHETFFSLNDLNQALRRLLTSLNERPFKKLPGSRRSQFEELDRPALNPLPPHPYELAEWKKARVHVDYHIEIEGHYYSVPHPLIRRELDVRLTATTIECFHNGQRVAAHPRVNRKGGHSTITEHMPKAHRAHQEWTPGRFLNWALSIGPHTRDLVQHLLTNRPHPEMGFRSCLGLLSLAKRYSNSRLEAACQRAIALGSPTRRSVVSILEKGLEAQPLPEAADLSLPTHRNIRGAAYYQ